MAKPPAPPARKPPKRWPGPLQFMEAFGAYQLVTAHHRHHIDTQAGDDVCADDLCADDLCDERDDDAVSAAADDADGYTVADEGGSDG